MAENFNEKPIPYMLTGNKVQIRISDSVLGVCSYWFAFSQKFLFRKFSKKRTQKSTRTSH